MRTLALRFSGNSHKRTAGPGQVSPLGIYIEYLQGSRTIAKDNVWLSLYRNERSWRFRDYAFTLKDYDYNDWLTLDVIRNQLEPVSAE